MGKAKGGDDVEWIVVLDGWRVPLDVHLDSVSPSGATLLETKIVQFKVES